MSSAGGAESRLQWLDGELAGRSFVTGERFTIADITLLVGIDFGRVTNIRIAPEQEPPALVRRGLGTPERQGLRQRTP